MNILVILRQWPSAGKSLENSGMCDSDKNVLCEALNLRDEQGGFVTVMALGDEHEQEIQILKEALTYGTDRALLVQISEDKTGVALAAACAAQALRKTGPYDVIFFGRQAIDGDSAHMAVMTAQAAGIPAALYSKKFECASDGEGWRAESETEHGEIQLSGNFPIVVVSVREDQKKRYPKISDILKVYSGQNMVEKVASPDILPLTLPKPVQIHTYVPETAHHQIQMIEGTDEEEKAAGCLKILGMYSFLEGHVNEG